MIERIHELAGVAASQFERRKRNGENDASTFVTLRKDHDKWVNDLVRHAHDDGAYLPDDTRYEMIEEVLDAIVDQEPQCVHDLEFEADVYTSDLLDWLTSNQRRQYYVDEWVDSYGWRSLSDAIMGGQTQELREIASLVWESLEEVAETEDEYEEDDGV